MRRRWREGQWGRGGRWEGGNREGGKRWGWGGGEKGARVGEISQMDMMERGKSRGDFTDGYDGMPSWT